MGQRAFIGKVSMDRNSPEFYIEETSSGCLDAENFVRHVLSQTSVGEEFLREVDRMSSSKGDSADVGSSNTAVKAKRPNESMKTLLDRQDSPLVMPVITPRFVPTCTPELMQFLGSISLKYGLPVQSHMSESVNEIEWVTSLHPEQESYAEVYEIYDLLHPRAYMAHCCHSTEEEIRVIIRSGSGVVHCPNSNFMLSSGIMDVRRFISEGIPVALGTDVAGGYSPSMLDAMRQTMTASQAKSFQHKAVDSVVKGSMKSSGYSPLNYREAFYLATMGGAKVLGMENVVGNFLPDKKMDCLVVDIHAAGSPIDIFEGEGVSEKFQKFLFNGDDRNIDTVFVDGKMVLGPVNDDS